MNRALVPDKNANLVAQYITRLKWKQFAKHLLHGRLELPTLAYLTNYKYHALTDCANGAHFWTTNNQAGGDTLCRRVAV